MLDVITANEIVNALQCKGHNIEWVKILRRCKKWI